VAGLPVPAQTVRSAGSVAPVLPAAAARAMKRGRPPKPAALHRLEGTFQAVRHSHRAASESQAPGDLTDMEPPEWMDAEHRAEWHRVLVDVPPGLLRRLDWNLFAAYIETVIRYREVIAGSRKLNNRALPYLLKKKGKDGQPDSIEVSPYVILIDRVLDRMLRLAGELGFTPVARARIATGDGVPDDGAQAEDWGAFPLRVIQGGRGGSDRQSG